MTQWNILESMQRRFEEDGMDHNAIKSRIRNGELTSYGFVGEDRGGEVLLLQFDTEPKECMIPPHEWVQYVDVLTEFGAKREITP